MSDAENLPELTTRQEAILAFIVRHYTQRPEPVGSRTVVDESELNVSSATIRNDMAVLEEKGYLAAPHKSAGRIPTQDGYRYFVRRLLTHNGLSDDEKMHIAAKFRATPVATEQWMRQAATTLARTARTASLVTTPVAETSQFKHMELIAIQGRLALMVLVLHGGMVQQRMLNLVEPVSQSALDEVAGQVNTLCADRYAHQIRMKAVQLNMLGREVAELVADVMDQASGSPTYVIYRDGLSDVLSTFPDGEGAQQAVRVFEEKAFLDMILAELIEPLSSDVRVIVGGNGHWEELSQVSMVVSRYGLPGQMSGTLGVVGPTHLNYGRAISTVRFVSSLMTDLFTNLFGETGEQPSAEDTDGD